MLWDHIDQGNEMNFGGDKWFGICEKLVKFHSIWTLYEGTSFTKLQSGQKLRKNAQGDRMKGLSSSLVSMGYLSMFSIGTQLELGIKHFLCKISEKAETCIGSCAKIFNLGTWDKDGTSDYI